jgi:hypothetical protein
MALQPCVYPECGLPSTEGAWCRKHWGLFPHACEHKGCLNRPVYDDEPFCFTHSPESGSSYKGYSAHKKALEKT